MIQAGKYEFHPEHWDNISDQAKDLIKHCLDVNYKTRYTPSQALMHPWITNVFFSSSYLLTKLSLAWKSPRCWNL